MSADRVRAVVAKVWTFALIIFVAVIAAAFLYGMATDSAEGTCEDVTSYDYNWDNDMKCTRSDGSIFYTDYDGAERFERSGDK